jgi:hypothetical protein
MGFKTLNWWRWKSSKSRPFRAFQLHGLWGSVQVWGIFYGCLTVAGDEDLKWRRIFMDGAAC